MAKRRNAKKEKAERNKINARKFRKPSTRYSGKGRRYSKNSNSNNDEKSSSETESKKSSSEPS